VNERRCVRSNDSGVCTHHLLGGALHEGPSPVLQITQNPEDSFACPAVQISVADCQLVSLVDLKNDEVLESAKVDLM
jgi:hypothetical protein